MAGVKGQKPRVWLVLASFVLGAGLFALGRMTGRRSPAPAPLPQEDLKASERVVKVGGRVVKALGGGTAQLRTRAFIAYRERGVPGVFRWDVAARYPVMDVPEGWVVAWVVQSQVVAIGTPDVTREGGRNLLVPAKPVDGALVVPVGLEVKAGDLVEGI